MSARWVLTGLLVLSGMSLLLALALGSITLYWQDLWAVMQGEPGLYRNLVMELRLPRALAAFATGGMLALAGALMQVLLRNPLADPYILGISGGAAVGALSSMLLGASGAWFTGSAFCGALLSMTLVFTLARGRGSWTSTRLLLTGVVVAAGWGAVISFILSISPDAHLRGMLFWLMGDLSHAQNPGMGWVVLLLGVILCVPLAHPLNALSRGELQASALGVAVQPLRLQVYVLASLLTAVAVTLAGSIGFVGLIVPHVLRLIIGNDQRILLPAAVLSGGSLLTLADTLARTVVAPQQLPVGVITALLGVPVFLYLLQRGQR
jgi:iron complex transport system permease protein